MEKRKVLKAGPSTLSISLPKDWLYLADVKHGAFLYLDKKEDGSLRIVSESLYKEEKKAKEHHINCDLIQEHKLLERLVVGSYVTGADLLKIFSSTRINGKQIEEVRNISQKIIGFNITKGSKREIILQSYLDPSKFNTYSLLQKLSETVSTMVDESTEALLTSNVELANDAIQREDEANSIFWLITRLILLARTRINKQFNPTSFRLVSKNLERIADCSERLAKIAIDFHKDRDTIDEKEMEKISFLKQLTKKSFRKAVDSIFSGDIIKANDSINQQRKLEAEFETRRSDTTPPYFRAITVLFAMIAENSAGIAAVAINNEMRKSNSFPYSS